MLIDKDIDKSRSGDLHPVDQLSGRLEFFGKLAGDFPRISFLRPGNDHGDIGGKIALAFMLGQFDGVPSGGSGGPQPLGYPLLKRCIDDFFQFCPDHDCLYVLWLLLPSRQRTS